MKRNRHVGVITVVHKSTIVKGFLALFIMMIVLFSISGILTSLRPEYRISSQSVKTVTDQFSGKLLFTLLANENHYFFSVLPEGKPTQGLTEQMLKISTNISLDDPRSLLGRELPGFSIFDSKILVAGEGTNYTNMPYESMPPAHVLDADQDAATQNVEDIKEPDSTPSENSELTTNGKKIVYVYNSHNRESFLPYLKGVADPNNAYHSELNITKLSKKLSQDLQNKGIGTSVNTTDVQAVLNQKGLNYTKSYQESRTLVKEAMATDQNLEYLIDIHRDSKRKKDTTITLNGKSYARVAFIIGNNNPNYEKNAALAKKVHAGLQKKYPGLSRGVMLQGGAGYNGIYNQDLSTNSILMEVGGVDNTFEEMYESIDAFADVFSEIFWDAEEVDTTPATTDN